MDIGTAKPSPAERARVPHHLIDVTTPDQPWTLAQFQAAALAAIREAQARGHLPFLVGGTGQYIRAVTEGWQPPAGAPSGALRASLEAELAREGVGALAERLRALDPGSAARVDLKNPRRVVRALEVVLATGQSFVAQQRKSPPPFAILTLGLNLPRPERAGGLDDGGRAAGGDAGAGGPGLWMAAACHVGPGLQADRRVPARRVRPG
jgi:tRNA dimethylallyltransferase